jgi:hypothetical protein
MARAWHGAWHASSATFWMMTEHQTCAIVMLFGRATNDKPGIPGFSRRRDLEPPLIWVDLKLMRLVLCVNLALL